MEVSEAEFERLVVDAIDLIDGPLGALMDNVAVFIEDEHPEEPDLLGLYEGIPLTERGEYGGFELPDRVTIYRLSLMDICADRDELVHEVQVTVVHELAHHFGIDDDRLHELGWG